LGLAGPAPFQGAPESNDCQIQGVALGLHPTALSAAEDVDLFEASVDCFSIMAGIYEIASGFFLVGRLTHREAINRTLTVREKFGRKAD
jgi:hypothetical protein